MQKTPHKTSQDIDEIIDQLNARWDLQIPRIHGPAAVKAGDGSDLAKKCSSRIRALCWNGNVNMKSVTEEFEDKVQHKYSHWIWKPSQVSGTLLSLPATKSFLKRDAISKNQGMTTQRRQTFLRALSGLLEDEYKLATESDQYQRTPSGPSRDTSRQTSFAGNRSTPSGSFCTADDSRSAATKTPEMKNAPKSGTTHSSSVKKREASQTASASSKRAKTVAPKPIAKPTAKPVVKNEKRQQSLDTMLRRQDGPSVELTIPDQSALNHSSDLDPNAQSFDTINSEEPERVFSESESTTPHSNETSFMSIDSDKVDRRLTEISGTQYSEGTDVDDLINNDVNVQRSFAEAEAEAEAEASVSPTTAAELLNNLSRKGPFRRVHCSLPTNLPYWLTFEIHRISLALSLGVSSLWRMVCNIRGKENLSAEELWQAVRVIHRDIKPSQEDMKVPLPAKSILPDWVTHNAFTYCDPDSGNSISFTAKLDFSTKATSQLFDFTLNPIKYEKSCRFHRKFGAHRFLTIDMPYYSQQLLKHYTKNMPGGQKMPTLHHTMFDWLTTNDLHIAGRVWRAFYVEPIKSRSKKKRKEEKARQRLHLFAIDGFDINKSHGTESWYQPMSLLSFIGWHLPLKHNLRSTDMKLFARIQLGLSRTLKTVVLDPNDFIHVPDAPAQDEHGRDVKDGTIMTDGCARISLQLADAVWAEHKKSGEDSPCPSAFQARIGGAKGLWQVDYSNAHPGVGEKGYWIEIRDSQLKIKPHPTVRNNADEEQRVFEVVKHSSPCVPGHLNIQLINIMHYCGVPRKAFADALNSDVKKYLASLQDAMKEPLELRVWHQVNHYEPSDTIEFCGGMPDSKGFELDYLLESGFAPGSCRYLSECVRKIAKQQLDTYVDKLRIQVDASTTVFCIPDPLGVLDPGEIQLNFSKPKMDPRTKLLEMHLESPKVLVARNPAHLASDIQLVRAVYHHDLRHLKDVAIFSIKGRYPLADLLSGGDYDGDTVTVIWDPDLTENFRNHDKPRLATKAECGVVSQTRYVGDIFNTTSLTQQQLEDFLRTCCSLNGFRSKLGEVTVEHEKLVYTDPANLGERGPEILAALAGYLVDSAKQGDSFSNAAWEKLRIKIHAMCDVGKDNKLVEPAYKEGAKLRPRRQKDGECRNIIDYLKYDVAKRLRDDVLIRFEKEWVKKTADEDEDLRRLYSRERERVTKSKLPEHQATAKVLDDLCEKIKAIREEWKRRYGPDDDDMPGAGFGNSNKVVRDDFEQVIKELSERIRAIEPLNLDCAIRRDFEREGGGRGTRWSSLRASCVHYKHQQGSFSWKMVGDELCDIKADAQGRTWKMTLAARQLMRVDPKKYKRLNEEDDGADVEFYDAED